MRTRLSLIRTTKTSFSCTLKGKRSKSTMSKVLSQDTQFTSIDLIRQAIEMQGFTPVFAEGLGLMQFDGYAGQKFEANVGIRKANYTAVTKGHTYGDLG